MTAAFASRHREETRAEQLESLRRRMASISSKKAGPTVPGDLLDSESQLALPQWLADLLPAPLPRGTVAVLSGARSLLLSMVAAVTAAGGNAAIVGQPDIGLLAAAEMGADLSRLAVIPDPGTDPVEVAAVLVDGMDLVVLGLGGRRVPPTRARAVVARARSKGCTLLVTGGDWQGAPTRLAARVCGYEITPHWGTPAPGFGRISGVRLQVSGMCAGRRVMTQARAG
ncbi:hypothetical protein [Mycobacterium intracellulare]|uniref:Uncharacterized protein n=1 Tax=Mycobacterium intracellulare subsp. chimaera TaxID=222805 RepID=A0A7U5MP65_MYCIT|nr:hypothetical protein [Mycobacterium intracellulare]ASL17157.1 hypothetical protein MYCOZU2_04794 [Mycobacterium intracellulare subsp. chimaera]ASQ88126.1 hypothetical protein CE197_22925 [Mycobacterium intracellulare subsp. chimaera]MCF1815398.1 hypothetical protein [Mycobacterium intracellulare subsp. intracellulare]MDM3926511.1 hypothetical protein [Mycobacterium intracellulare subsp. chimaera]MDS0337174.1 hypothetical protein [Mycobacterium intracellulare]